MKSKPVLLSLILLTLPAVAAPIPIQNAGFEDAVLGPGGFNSTVPSGWERAVNNLGLGTFYPTVGTWGYTASEGNDLFYANGGFIEQATTALVEPGLTYTLRVDVIHRPSYFNNGYVVQLLAGPTVVAEDLGGLSPPIGGFAVSELSFTPNPGDPLIGQPLTVRLGGATQSNFDHVRLEVVPEPAALSLLVLGLAFVRRR